MAGCSEIEPLELLPKDEIPHGPGIFTGSKGEWVFRLESILTIDKDNELSTPLDYE